MCIAISWISSLKSSVRATKSLTQQDDGLLEVALGIGERLLAVHHGRSGFLAELFHLVCGNIHSSCAHKFSFKFLDLRGRAVPRSFTKLDPRRTRARV